jgi:hypothetical protein
MKIRVCLLATVLIHIVLFYALYCKGDVKAAFKFMGVEFSLETKDKAAQPNRPQAPAENSPEPRSVSAGRVGTILEPGHNK